MWRHIDVQADWRRSWTYGQASNAIGISQGSLTCPSKHRHGANLFNTVIPRNCPIYSPFKTRLRYGRTHSRLNPRPLIPTRAVCIGRIVCKMFGCVSFWLHCSCGWWEGWVPVNRFGHTVCMFVVIRTGRPLSVCNRCVVEGFGGVLVLSICFRIFCWYRNFC